LSVARKPLFGSLLTSPAGPAAGRRRGRWGGRCRRAAWKGALYFLYVSTTAG